MSHRWPHSQWFCIQTYLGTCSSNGFGSGAQNTGVLFSCLSQHTHTPTQMHRLTVIRQYRLVDSTDVSPTDSHTHPTTLCHIIIALVTTNSSHLPQTWLHTLTVKHQYSLVDSPDTLSQADFDTSNLIAPDRNHLSYPLSQSGRGAMSMECDVTECSSQGLLAATFLTITAWLEGSGKTQMLKHECRADILGTSKT